MTMENSYKGGSGGYFQYSSEKKNNVLFDLNTFALDLSCKKRVAPTLCGANEVVGSSQTSLANPRKCTKAQTFEQINYLERGQTPIAGSSAMLSPFSESNSPKKIEPVDYYGNNGQLNQTSARYLYPQFNMHDVTLGVTMVTPQRPSLPVHPNEATNIAVAIPAMPIPHMETSQSFRTNEAGRQISMPAECSTTTSMKSRISLLEPKTTPRPFKAYPNNILSVVPTLDFNLNKEYTEYRQKILEKINKIYRKSNAKMRRAPKSPGLPTSTVDEKGAAYWERRRKNNEAAKRSRDARRAKEDEIAIRASFLEQENTRLRCELETLKNALLCNNNNHLPH